MRNCDSLGDRMKRYEKAGASQLYRRIPVIMRLDGRAFHTFTKKYCERPFDQWFQTAMYQTTKTLLTEIQGAKCAYVQSDEITILITDFDRLNSEAWFNYNVQKMCSIGASIATVAFNNNFAMQAGKSNPNLAYRSDHPSDRLLAQFDARVFNIPKEDVANNFIWRQKDWLRNSIQMYCRSFFSHKELEGKKQADMHEMLHGIKKNWAKDLLPSWKNGIFVAKPTTCLVKTERPGWTAYFPIFTENREIFDELMTPEEE